MKCLVCGNLVYKKNLCDNCLLKTKKIKCKDCGEEKLDIYFYTYKKTNRPYAVCKDCFNKKIECNVCHLMINKTYLKKHLEKCKIKFGSGMQKNAKLSEFQGHLKIENENITENIENENIENENIKNENIKNENIENKKDSDENLFKLRENNRTLIVGPSFCGKTHLLLNVLRLKKLDCDKKIVIITRSPDQYNL